MTFRVSIAQQPLVWQDAAANRAHFAKVLAPLAGATDLVVLPEMFTTGFTMQPETQAEAADGETRAWLLAAGECARCGRRRQRGGQRSRPVLQPLHDRDAGRPDLLVRQAPPVPHGRRTPPLQRAAATRSSSSGAARGCVRWCATTCGFPVWSRRRPELEYDVVIYAANWPAARRFAWEVAAARARHREPGLLRRCESRGDDGAGVAHAGDSVVLDFTGKPLLELNDTRAGDHRAARSRSVARLARQVSRASRRRCLFADLMTRP